MKWRIAFTGDEFRSLRSHLLRGSDADEEAALLLCGIAKTTARTTLLVREVLPVPDDAMLAKGRAGITITPEFFASALKACRTGRFSMVQAHSHPFSDSYVGFSGVDDFGEERLFPKLQARAPDSVFGAVVFGQNSFDARVWPAGSSTSTPVEELVSVGTKLEHFPRHRKLGRGHSEKFARQEPVIGAVAQSLLAQMVIGIVGLGGMGSIVAQELAHLGVRKFILMDPDAIEESNRSRIVGSRASDVGMKKVEVIAQYLKKSEPDTAVQAVDADVYHCSAALQLRVCDAIFCCTDTLVSRMVLTRFAPQYYIPVIDMGINVQLGTSGDVQRIGGRVMIQNPTDPCLDCLGILDQQAISRELAQNDERFGMPYVTGNEAEFAPAVISLNGVVASLAVTEFLNLVSGRFQNRSDRVYHVYDGIKGVTRAVHLTPEKRCGVCDEVRGMGDLMDLPCILNK